MKSLVLTAILTILLAPTIIFATDYQASSSETISATITIKPNQIVAEEPASIWLQFEDSASIFTLKRCDCRIKIITEDNKVIIDYPILQNDQYINEFAKEIPLIFPQIGIYKILISGESQNKVFKSFQMETTIEITTKHVTEREKRWQSFKERVVSFAIPFIAILFAIGIGLRLIAKKGS